MPFLSDSYFLISMISNGSLFISVDKLSLKVSLTYNQFSCYRRHCICNSYTMGCPPVRGDNPRALASGLSYVQVDNP